MKIRLSSEDEDDLHYNISYPSGCDPPPKQFFRFHDKFVIKSFDVDDRDHKSLFCGVIDNYDKKPKKHEVNYEDGEKISYSADEIMQMIEIFER